METVQLVLTTGLSVADEVCPHTSNHLQMCALGGPANVSGTSIYPSLHLIHLIPAHLC